MTNDALKTSIDDCIVKPRFIIRLTKWRLTNWRLTKRRSVLHLPRLVSCTAIFTYSLVHFLLRNYKEKSFGSRLSWDSNLVLVLCHHRTSLHLHSSNSFSLSRYARHRSREDLRGRNDCLFPAVNIKTSCCSNRSLKRLSSYVQLLLQIMNNNKYFLIPKCDNYKYGMRSDSF